MKTHIIVNGRVENTILAGIEEARQAYPDALCVDAALGGAIGDDYSSGVFSTPAAVVDLSALKKQLATRIDLACIEVFSKPTTLARVYERRESEAIAFRDAGFIGEPGEYIKNFADPAGLTYEAAARLVLQQAAALRTAQDNLEALRMRKNEVLRAGTEASAQSLYTEITTSVAAIATMLG